MSKVYLLTCQSGSSNKFWKCEINGGMTKVWYGRIGGSTPANQPQVKNHGSSYDAEAFYQKKSAEKIHKGYKLTTEDKLSDETEKAQLLGTRNKISKMKFIFDRTNKKIIFGETYDPEQGVYVEILDSWSKDVTSMLITKKTATNVTGKCSTTEFNIQAQYGGNSRAAAAVRKVLRGLSEQVQKVVQTFAGLSSRSLDLGADVSEEIDLSSVILSNSSVVSAEVVHSFTNMGSRTLDI